MRLFLQNLLANLARKILAKYKPKIIGITGSVGKTSTKEAIFLVVKEKYKTRRSEKNFNNEFGLPLTIIGAGSPGRNPFAWLGVLIKAVYEIVFPANFPEVLVLEMGIDRPGDMNYLLSIAKPDIGVITSIGISHREFFSSADQIAEEKGKLAVELGPTDVLVVNADNELALSQRQKTPAHAITYGIDSDAMVHLENNVEMLQAPYGSELTVRTPSRDLNIKLRTLGRPHLLAALAAVAVGEALSISSELIAEGLAEYKAVPGRLNLISGIKKSLLIDDSYNAAPDSMRQALELMKRLPQKNKIAILGDMRELGEQSELLHKQIGALAASITNYLLTVGEGGKIIAEGAREAGLASDVIFSFDDSETAGSRALDLLQPETVILIKGSQAVRMERATAELMAEPMRASELLPRQYGHWIK